MLDFKEKDELLKDRENNEILFHSIVGSQNYGLDNKNSDIDTKAVVLLDFKDIIKKRTYNKDIKWEDDAITSLKDLEEYKKLLVKSNINILETLFSKEYSYNNKFKDEIEELLDNRENIANIDPIRLLKSERGFSFQVYKKNNEYNNDTYTKDSYQILKTENFIKNFFIEKMSFSDSIKYYENKNDIMNIKSNKIDIKEAKEILLKSFDNIDDMYEQIDKSINKSINEQTIKWLNDWNIRVYKKYLEI